MTKLYVLIVDGSVVMYTTEKSEIAELVSDLDDHISAGTARSMFCVGGPSTMVD